MGKALLLGLLIMGVPTLVLATRYWVARRRRRRSTAATLAWIGTLSLVRDPLELVAEQAVAPMGGESVQLRTLRSQVRTLEQALEEEQTQHVDTAGEDLESYRRQVHAVIRAMGGKLDAGEAGSQILARVSAAIDRLSVPASFDRPALAASSAPATSPARAGAVGLLERAPAVTAASALAPTARETVPTPAPFAAVQPEVPQMPAAYDEPEVVLPVPPMAESTENRRGRRRLRGNAA